MTPCPREQRCWGGAPAAVVEGIRRRRTNGQSGDDRGCRATAGVAISSVSSALNNRLGVSDSTRARILEVAVELGFVPSST
ncbi:helix-turn-helix domain-containing protein [Herbiconiux sp. UC225_62]|uniref:helix-turn-helix domain-containing protein n=1 Tax=Herbiconiux sp. UC225_62 TaxID=3350168 RepID=UPI0036D3C70F